MTKMIDVDGVEIPLNGGYAPFDLTLFSDGKMWYPDLSVFTHNKIRFRVEKNEL